MAQLTPPALRPGDEIHIIATARFVEKDFIKTAEKVISDWGFTPILGENLFAKSDQFAGTDEERLADLNTAVRNPNCRAILCARGGYGTARIIDNMDLAALKKDPTWIAGYSDITALLHHVYTQIGLESLHATMPVNFETNHKKSLSTLRAALQGEQLGYSCRSHTFNRNGEAEGELIGGNLSVIYSLLGSPTSIDTRGKILFIEDLDEYLYHVDRIMLALGRAGMLDGLAGLIIGGMSDMNDNIVPFGKTAEEIICDRVKNYSFPVAYGFPSGHTPENQAWIHGKKIRLIVQNDQPSKISYL